MPSQDDPTRSGIDAAHAALDEFAASGLLPVEAYAGRRVLDWECGQGFYSAALAERGSASVLGIDSWFDASTTFAQAPLGVSFGQRSLTDLLEEPARAGSFGLVFANTVSEHLPDLPNRIRDCARALMPGGVLVLNHDNYYHPVGSHDHGFLGNGPHGIDRQGPACWDDAASCAASAEHRASVMARFPWTWDQRMEESLTPDDCGACPYFRRSQPWGHLLYQDDFLEVYPQRTFATGLENAGLNKVMPQQLRQFVAEAGLCVEHWGTTRVANTPPPELLAPPHDYPAQLLTTWMVQARASKPAT